MIANAFSKFIFRMIKKSIDNKEENPFISPKKVHDVMKSFSRLEHFCNYTQQDAHEFLKQFIDGIHEDLNERVKRYIKEPDFNSAESKEMMYELLEEKWRNCYLQRNNSIMVQLFYGLLKNTITCSHCGIQTTKFDEFSGLELPIKYDSGTNHDVEEKCRKRKNVEPLIKTDFNKRRKLNNGSFIESKQSLKDCLNAFTDIEKLSKGNEYKCKKCGKKTNGNKKLDIWWLPNNLLITLKRFDDHFRKIENIIECPINNLDLTSMCKGLEFIDIYSNNHNGSFVFDLYAMINHVGSLNHGHYTATIKFNNEWYHMNDAFTTKLKGTPNTDNAYILFYKRHE